MGWPDLERDIKEEFANVAASDAMPVDDRTSAAAPRTVASSTGQPTVLDLSGEWDVLEVEDDKRYRATLDKTGNGPYTQHGGQFVTTKFTDHLWQGTWRQPGQRPRRGIRTPPLRGWDPSQRRLVVYARRH